MTARAEAGLGEDQEGSTTRTEAQGGKFYMTAERPQFGWGPEPDAFLNLPGCAAALVKLRQVRRVLNQAMQQRAEGERGPYIDEMARLAGIEAELKARQGEITEARDKAGMEPFTRAFREVAKERLDRALYLAICEEASARVRARAEVPSSVANSRAIAPIGGGGGIRERR